MNEATLKLLYFPIEPLFLNKTIIGYISEKDALPIQRLNFGKVSSPVLASGAFTLGKFECSGRAVVNGMPESCRDVYRIGHIFNDFYSIKRNEKIEMVFCDFSLSPFDPS